MNSTTTNYAVPKLTTVLTVGSAWLTAFAAILAFHLTKVASAEEFATTLIAALGVAFAAVVAIRASIVVWRSEKGDSFVESMPGFRPALGTSEVKAA